MVETPPIVPVQPPSPPKKPLIEVLNEYEAKLKAEDKKVKADVLAELDKRLDNLPVAKLITDINHLQIRLKSIEKAIETSAEDKQAELNQITMGWNNSRDIFMQLQEAMLKAHTEFNACTLKEDRDALFFHFCAKMIAACTAAIQTIDRATSGLYSVDDANKAKIVAQNIKKIEEEKMQIDESSFE